MALLFNDLEIGQEVAFIDRLSSGSLRAVVEDRLSKEEGKEGFMLLTNPSEMEDIAVATASKVAKIGEAEFVNLGGSLKVRFGLTVGEMSVIFKNCRDCHL